MCDPNLLFLENIHLFLGSGAYGFVKKALCKSNRLEVAVKIIPKSRVKERFKMVQDEMKVLKHLSHPNIICLYDWFESR